jgi:hypothetical protein
MRFPVVVGLMVVSGIAGGMLGRDRASLDSAVEIDEASLIAAFVDTQDVLGRAERLVPLLGTMDRSNADLAARVYEEHLDDLGAFEIRLLIASWSRFDAKGATQVPLAWPKGRKRSVALEEAGRSWALRDPRAAHAFVETLKLDSTLDDPTVSSLHHGVVEGWIMNGDIAGATNILATLPRGQYRELRTRDLADEILGAEGPAAVEGWAEEIPDDAPEDFKHVVYRKAVLALLEHDRERAVGWVERNAHTEHGQTAMKVLSRVWSSEEPDAATEWIWAQPEGRAQRTALLIAFREWGRVDALAANGWLEEREWSSDLDPLANVMAQRLIDSDLEAAIAWAGRIADLKLRSAALAQIGEVLSRRGGQRLSSLDGLQLSEGDRMLIEMGFRRGPGRGDVRSPTRPENPVRERPSYEERVGEALDP